MQIHEILSKRAGPQQQATGTSSVVARFWGHVKCKIELEILFVQGDGKHVRIINVATCNFHIRNPFSVLCSCKYIFQLFTMDPYCLATSFAEFSY